MRVLWLGLGWLSIVLGVLGIALPLLPTTPFLLLAAYSFSRGSKRLHDWLLNHPTLGPPINDWQQNRTIARKTKIVASITMLGVFALSVILAAPIWALLLQGSILTGVATFLWTRRDSRDTKET